MKSRRTFMELSALTAALSALPQSASAMGDSQAARPATGNRSGVNLGATMEEAGQVARSSHQLMDDMPSLNMRGTEQVAMVVYPAMTMLDMVGPQYFFASLMGAKVHLVSKDTSLKPLMGDTGFAIVPTISMADCPADLDVLFVPGGVRGTLDFMQDKESIDFMVDRGSRARFVTSVCTGSMILGQAGLLDGKRATSHWGFHHLLPEFGATAVSERVVRDGNVITGAGVSAGLDLGITVVEALRGPQYAKLLQLQGEYDPQPPFDAGTPEKISPNLSQPLHGLFAGAIYEAKETAQSRRTSS